MGKKSRPHTPCVEEDASATHPGKPRQHDACHPCDCAPILAAPGMRELITRKVADLIPYAHNSRMHGEAQIAQIAASITEFGFTNPVLIDEQSTIIAGHARVLGAQRLKMTTVPCVVLPGLTDAQKAAYVIADNKLALNARWDEEMLQTELARLADLQFDLNLTGFSEVEINALLEEIIADLTEPAADTGVTQPDESVTQLDAGSTLPASVPIEPPNDWTGMPEFDQPEAGPFRTLKVHFNDQTSVDKFAKLIGQNLTDKTKWVWYPALVKVAAEKFYA